MQKKVELKRRKKPRKQLLQQQEKRLVLHWFPKEQTLEPWHNQAEKNDTTKEAEPLQQNGQTHNGEAKKVTTPKLTSTAQGVDETDKNKVCTPEAGQHKSYLTVARLDISNGFEILQQDEQKETQEGEKDIPPDKGGLHLKQ